MAGRPFLADLEIPKNDLLYQGSKEAIQNKVREILDETGRKGVVIGADCTVPNDIAAERIAWVKEAVADELVLKEAVGF